MMTIDDDALANVHGGINWSPQLLTTLFADTTLYGAPTTGALASSALTSTFTADPMVLLQQAGTASPPLVDVPSALPAQHA